MSFPKDLIAKCVTTVHRTVFDISKGRVAGGAMGMPVVKLTTIGRKSGKRRATMLTSPLVVLVNCPSWPLLNSAFGT